MFRVAEDRFCSRPPCDGILVKSTLNFSQFVVQNAKFFQMSDVDSVRLSRSVLSVKVIDVGDETIPLLAGPGPDSGA